jgi:hypothetical protein
METATQTHAILVEFTGSYFNDPYFDLGNRTTAESEVTFIPFEGFPNSGTWPQPSERRLSSVTPVKEEDLPNNLIDNSCRSGQDPPEYLREVLGRLIRSSGREKASAREEIREIVSSHLDTRFKDIHASINYLVAAHSAEKIDNAIDLLAMLEPSILEPFAWNALTSSPPDHTNDEYWYAVIRALGRAGRSEIIEPLSRFSVSSVREAVAEALSDIRDAKSLALLRKMAEADSSPFIRKLANELCTEPE